ncbi:MAG: hypothetical protein JWP10_996 [Nocardioidaceae bacterium]|nr:hypothetical protein [Nocardioidaceae bacterium]
MSRRVSVPEADNIFRATVGPDEIDGDGSQPSGRVKHDEKMTVYLTADELLAIEQARLKLRTLISAKVDRGRLVRAALAIALADLEADGADSALAKQLSGQ